MTSTTRTSGPCCARGSTRVADVGHPPAPCTAMERDRPGRRRTAAQRHHGAVIEHLSPGHPVEDPHLESSPVAAQHPDREHLRHQPAYDEPARLVGAQHPGVGAARPGPAHVERTQSIEVGLCPSARSAYVPLMQHLERLDELAASRHGAHAGGLASWMNCRCAQRGQQGQDSENPHAATLPANARPWSVVHRLCSAG